MKTEIIIIGAGASGLMAAWELGKAGKRVIILEARDRIGGRIWPLPEEEFGYPAQAGAEFVHGDAPITKSLFQKAGMTLTPTQGDMWNSSGGNITINSEMVPNQDLLREQLKALTKDISIAEFFEQYFPGEEYANLRKSVFRMVEGYDAADPRRISTFALREEWLGGGRWLQYRIKEGYGTLLSFLENECKTYGVEIRLGMLVKEIKMNETGVRVYCADGSIYEAGKVVLTIPIPLLKEIKFTPAIPEKLDAASKIGFGGVIKLLLKFKSRWWVNALGKDFNEMDFMLSQNSFKAWWTQYPDPVPVLTGWLAGPESHKFISSSFQDIIDVGLVSLADIFKVEKDFLKNELTKSKVINWLADPLARGAYSYSTTESPQAYLELSKPVKNTIFFAGEALCSGNESATVEGALASGLETANKILNTQDLSL